jgi:hypothetical protein
VADPSRTLGSTGGAPTDEEAGEQDNDDLDGILTQSLKERFNRR